jgi:hypothetical protein
MAKQERDFRVIRASTLCFSIAIFATAASAQNAQLRMPDPAPPSPAPYAPQCSDFRLNPDGSWSPLHAVTVGDVTISQKAAFLPGSKIGGVDLATLLDTQCAGKPSVP